MSDMETILIANRGEIAHRIIKSISKLGLKSIAIYSEDDKDAPHVCLADLAIPLDGQSLDETYLNIEKIINIAKTYQVDGIHPGYGFLAENSTFAQRCAEENIRFIGPDAKTIELMGDKTKARETLIQHDMPCVPGADNIANEAELKKQAKQIGYPIMLKAALGGGGRGMRVVENETALLSHYQSAQRESLKAFTSDHIFLEKYIKPARHIEVQILADTHGHILHLGTRDCSVQRRQQKLIEEAPAILTAKTEEKILQIALDIAQCVNYQNAGTIEFLVDDKDNIYFLEMNTRLQVEHCVTEAITGLDIVALQIEVANGKPLSLKQEDIHFNGHAIEARVCAEDAHADFMPQTGKIQALLYPHRDNIRIDSGITQGLSVTNKYDSLLFKLITTGPTRENALTQLVKALQHLQLFGVTTNQSHLLDIVNDIKSQNTLPNTDYLKGFSQETHYPKEQALIFSTLLSHQQSSAKAYPSICQGWTSSTPLSSLFFFSLNDEITEVKLEAKGKDVFQVQISGKTHLVKQLKYHANSIELDIDNKVSQCFYLRHQNEIHLMAQGHSQTVLDCSYQISQSDKETSSLNITAPMDGAVVAINAAMGKAIKKGDIVITLESMKMEHQLSAKVDGIVDSLNVVQGQQVKSKELLMTLADKN